MRWSCEHSGRRKASRFSRGRVPRVVRAEEVVEGELTFKVDQVYKFKPSDKMYISGDELPFIYVPENSQFASVQVTYKDGTTSPVQKIQREK